MLLEANQRTGRFYDLTRPLYPLIEPFLRSRRRRLIGMVNEHPPGDLLEIGVGTGTHLGSYAEHRVTGVDVSAGMLAAAARRGTASGAELRLMDGERLAFPGGSFDYVVMCHVLSVTADSGRMLRESHRVLRSGGRLFILNHETPRHALRHWDRMASCLAWLLRLRLWFRMEEIPGWENFSKVRRESCGLCGYYTITILQK